MAKLIGPLKIRGTIDDLTFRQCGNEIIVQAKPGPTREQVLHSPNCELTRRNSGEFKLVTKDSALLRRALGTTLNSVRDMGLNGRMNGLMHRVSRTDEYSEYGYRHVGGGDMGLLGGFDFNKLLSLDKALPVPVEHSLDVTSGTVRLEVPSFIARRKRDFPKGATHFRIVSCAAVVDFVHDSYANTIKTTELLPLGRKTPAAICQDHRLTVQPGEVLIQVMGIEFYRVENGKSVLLKGGAVRILEAVRMEDGLPESAPVRKEDNPVKPFTIKELRSELDRSFKRMAGRDRQVPMIGNCLVCCWDVDREKGPDIEAPFAGD
jgi:hypothetical protein